MSLTLYHSTESTCAQKVRIVMAEKQLNWTENRLNLRKGDQFSPEYLKLNPKAVVPTLIHDDRVIRESTVIIEYLEDAFPDPALRPEDLYDRSRMRLVVKAFDDEVHPAIGVLSYAIFLRHQMNELMSPAQLEEHFQKVVDPMRRERQQKTHQQGLQSPSAKVAILNLHKVIGQLDSQLIQGPWLAGKTFSLADASAAPYMVRAKALNLSGLWDERVNIVPWLERAVDRTRAYALEEPWGSSSFQKVVEKYADAALPEIQELTAGVD